MVGHHVKQILLLFPHHFSLSLCKQNESNLRVRDRFCGCCCDERYRSFNTLQMKQTTERQTEMLWTHLLQFHPLQTTFGFSTSVFLFEFVENEITKHKCEERSAHHLQKLNNTIFIKFSPGVTGTSPLLISVTTHFHNSKYFDVWLKSKLRNFTVVEQECCNLSMFVELLISPS